MAARLPWGPACVSEAHDAAPVAARREAQPESIDKCGWVCGSQGDFTHNTRVGTPRGFKYVMETPCIFKLVGSGLCCYLATWCLGRDMNTAYFL